ncbi:hypothetical protein SAMN05192573_114115 [Mucilaginibacter gossypii]|uniref:Uncharacterized protein n=1 Tax=Mucilaginibacter gossypii TaxID=551996 RepID=A0A1G8GNI0_9SPHI|nr:hypothetical protein SAMN05192573_114115 [Mucilaginibacter gossypii]
MYDGWIVVFNLCGINYLRLAALMYFQSSIFAFLKNENSSLRQAV